MTRLGKVYTWRCSFCGQLRNMMDTATCSNPDCKKLCPYKK